ncbi:hypothetical protein [Desulfitobacterium hafniense]|uniref:hypothetical protein n=1 Tax=Desulfitobacterium hafniense TaxID=49338 RepID=UPI0003823EBF|nr:hypothetical protein [Desulfitobacterium hafniense]
MKCAYCSNEAPATKEHIISSAILDLFPECYLTVDENRKVIHASDPMVKDVCAECNNNRISYIDNYAKQLVQKYFLQKYEEDTALEFHYDYAMVQKILLKYAFNDLRSRKEDSSFFNKTILDFLMNENNNSPLNHVSVLAGLAVILPQYQIIFLGILNCDGRNLQYFWKIVLFGITIMRPAKSF